MLPTRFETIPSRPISQAFSNTSPPSAAIRSLNMMGVGALDDALKLRAPVLDRLPANVFAAELEKIESDIGRAGRAGLRADRRHV